MALGAGFAGAAAKAAFVRVNSLSSAFVVGEGGQPLCNGTEDVLLSPTEHAAFTSSMALDSLEAARICWARARSTEGFAKATCVSQTRLHLHAI